MTAKSSFKLAVLPSKELTRILLCDGLGFGGGEGVVLIVGGVLVLGVVRGDLEVEAVFFLF